MFTSRLAACVSLVIALIMSLLPIHRVEAKDPPPPPIVITETVSNNSGLLQPMSAYYGPYGEQMVITNRYYPGQYKTDGWTDANFQQPGLHTIVCRSRVHNDLNQYSQWQQDSSGWGGVSCGPTPISSISNPKRPTTYRSETRAFWTWQNESEGYGVAEQSFYEP